MLVAMIAAGCVRRPPHQEGWAEIAVKRWATPLGVSDPAMICSSHSYAWDGSDAYATCSVNMGNKIYLLYCNVDYQSGVATRECVQAR